MEGGEAEAEGLWVGSVNLARCREEAGYVKNRSTGGGTWKAMRGWFSESLGAGRGRAGRSLETSEPTYE